MVLAKYKIRYSSGIEQVKNLVKQEDYDQFQNQVSILVKDSEPKNKKANEVEIKRLTNEFKSLHGDEYFTTGSPLGVAIHSGLLVLPEHQGGITECLITIL